MTAKPPVEHVTRSRRDAQKQATREALIDAARVEFLARGYANTRLEDITKRAEAAPATFYLHFSAKRDLAAHFAGELRADANEYYEQLNEVAYTATPDTIAAWIASTMQRWEALGPLVRVVNEAAGIEPALRPAQQSVIEDGITAVTNGLRRAGRFTDGSEHTRGMLAMSLHEGTFHEYLRRGSFTDRAEIKRVLTQMWLAALTV